MFFRKHCFFYLSLLVILLLCPFGSAQAESKNTRENLSIEGIAPDNADTVLAKLSDEQVRSLLLAELASKTAQKNAAQQGKNLSGGIIRQATGWLHILDQKESTARQSDGFFSSLVSVPADYLTTARIIGNGALSGFIVIMAFLFLVLAAAFLAEFSVRRFSINFSKQFQEKGIPEMDGPMRFVAGLMRAIPAFLHILIFSISAVFLFFLVPASAQPPVRYVFSGMLLIILFYRILKQLSLILLSPDSAALRVLPVNDQQAGRIHKTLLFVVSYAFTAIVFLALLLELQASQACFSLTALILATLLIVLIIRIILHSRDVVKSRILAQSWQQQTNSWLTEQFAGFWHVPVIAYFLVILITLINDVISGVQREGSAFLLSLFVLPLFVIFDVIGQWVVRVSIKTLRIYNPNDTSEQNKEEQEELARAQQKERKLHIITSRIVRLAILAALAIWVFSLWGYHIPYAAVITGAVFESLITIALALMFWRFASSTIERKISASEPEKEESSDDEFGGAKPRERSHTLLPMLRKFIATTLVVMVVLIVLSSIGVNIGPLLAGAGVVGLAVGFGAQKLVSDVLSGFFYLFDDAFRVGEYIQAGSVSGAVEAITLRNVMLRHHRGMLQIVPYSELGSITNFMRGGLVVKFNLEFPYDTDIDKVRKIIKKVGIAMLADEEFGNNFIQPVKSQGVREITGSVMVIRVKFTAKPGTQFVIQREAYRRITEALAAKGIHYAHRKVIVELPEGAKNVSPEEQQKIAEAGAAAELARQEEEKQQKDAGDS